jgi:enoyl-[acyl-carrier-protein] reductase (NADH)
MPILVLTSFLRGGGGGELSVAPLLTPRHRRRGGALLDRIRTRASNGGPSEPEALATLAADTALGRLASADEVDRAVLFLASEMAGGITGELLPVDAGFG